MILSPDVCFLLVQLMKNGVNLLASHTIDCGMFGTGGDNHETIKSAVVNTFSLDLFLSSSSFILFCSSIYFFLSA